MPKNPTKYMVVNNDDADYFDNIMQHDTVAELREAVEELLDDGNDQDNLTIYKIQQLDFTAKCQIEIDGLPKPKSEDENDD